MMPDGVEVVAKGFIGCNLTVGYFYYSAQNIISFEQKSSRIREVYGSALPAH